jgi:hypothetical protein
VSTDPTTPAASGAPANPEHPDWSLPQKVAGGAAIGGLVAFAIGAAILAADDHAEPAAVTQMFSAYLAGYIFWFSLPVGGLALLMIHYLAKTSWGLLLKRPIESATRTLPLMFLLFIPIVVGVALGEKSPYWWTAPEHSHEEKTLADAAKDLKDKKDAGAEDASRIKALEIAEERVRRAVTDAIEHERDERDHGNLRFLSLSRFIGVGIVLFAIWGTLIYFLNKWGQDAEDDPAKVESSLDKCGKLSGPGLIIYAITITVASTQWVMSLQEGWASTMFPVIFAVNQFLTCFAFSVACFLLLVGRPPFKALMRPKFQIDMGSLMLAFTLFWSYTSFSQMMLIWIGNLPEEIPFFLKRSNNTGWWWVSAVLVVFHFGLPFILLLFRDIKMHPVRLRVMATYLLVVCAIDVVWWVEPTHPHNSPLFILLDIGAIVGIGGLWGLVFLYHLKQRPLIPTNETYMLPEGHHHHEQH